MSDTSFTEVITPQERVREFYRRQGEARQLDRVLNLLAVLEDARHTFGLDIAVADAREAVAIICNNKFANKEQR
jgi:hypothetical protein